MIARRPSPRFRRGAAILPSLFTTANLFLGFWAIVKTFHAQYAEAAPLILWAAVLDVLDGRIARLTGTSSEFGGELDSLVVAVEEIIRHAQAQRCVAIGAVEEQRAL